MADGTLLAKLWPDTFWQTIGSDTHPRLSHPLQSEAGGLPTGISSLGGFDDLNVLKDAEGQRDAQRLVFDLSGREVRLPHGMGNTSAGDGLNTTLPASAPRLYIRGGRKYLVR
jgi:hypothetical protein